MGSFMTQLAREGRIDWYYVKTKWNRNIRPADLHKTRFLKILKKTMFAAKIWNTYSEFKIDFQAFSDAHKIIIIDFQKSFFFLNMFHFEMFFEFSKLSSY